jgi:hypothetical protein
MKVHKQHAELKMYEVPNGGIALLNPSNKLIAYSRTGRLYEATTFETDWDFVVKAYQFTSKKSK